LRFGVARRDTGPVTPSANSEVPVSKHESDEIKLLTAVCPFCASGIKATPQAETAKSIIK
jgi:hypothetical protein